MRKRVLSFVTVLALALAFTLGGASVFAGTGRQNIFRDTFEEDLYRWTLSEETDAIKLAQVGGFLEMRNAAGRIGLEYLPGVELAKGEKVAVTYEVLDYDNDEGWTFAYRGKDAMTKDNFNVHQVMTKTNWNAMYYNVTGADDTSTAPDIFRAADDEGKPGGLNNVSGRTGAAGRNVTYKYVYYENGNMDHYAKGAEEADFVKSAYIEAGKTNWKTWNDAEKKLETIARASNALPVIEGKIHIGLGAGLTMVRFNSVKIEKIDATGKATVLAEEDFTEELDPKVWQAVEEVTVKAGSKNVLQLDNAADTAYITTADPLDAPANRYCDKLYDVSYSLIVEGLAGSANCGMLMGMADKSTLTQAGMSYLAFEKRSVDAPDSTAENPKKVDKVFATVYQSSLTEPKEGEPAKLKWTEIAKAVEVQEGEEIAVDIFNAVDGGTTINLNGKEAFVFQCEMEGNYIGFTTQGTDADNTAKLSVTTVSVQKYEYTSSNGRDVQANFNNDYCNPDDFVIVNIHDPGESEEQQAKDSVTVSGGELKFENAAWGCQIATVDEYTSFMLDFKLTGYKAEEVGFGVVLGLSTPMDMYGSGKAIMFVNGKLGLHQLDYAEGYSNDNFGISIEERKFDEEGYIQYRIVAKDGKITLYMRGEHDPVNRLDQPVCVIDCYDTTGSVGIHVTAAGASTFSIDDLRIVNLDELYDMQDTEKPAEPEPTNPVTSPEPSDPGKSGGCGCGTIDPGNFPTIGLLLIAAAGCVLLMKPKRKVGQR